MGTSGTPITPSTDLEELIPMLRIKLGDTDLVSPRYLDSWLFSALQAGMTALMRWWDSKYSVDDDGVVTRSTDYIDWEFTSPPVIQTKDEWIIILMSSFIIKTGQLENLSWDLSNWKDSELQFSNLESGRQKDSSLKRDIEELEKYLKPPIKRGFSAQRIDYTEQT